MDFDFTAVSAPRYSAHTNGGAHFIGERKTKAQAEAVVTALALDSLRRYGSGTVSDIAGRLDCSSDVARRVLERLVTHNAARRKETRDGSLYIAVREPVVAASRVVKRVQPTNDGTVEPFILKPDETARGAIVRYFQERGGEASSKTLYLAFEGQQRYWTRDSIATHARNLASRGILKRRHERQNTSGGRQPFALYSLGDVPTDAEEPVEPFLMNAGESVYAAIIRFFQERGGEASASALFSAFAGQRGLTRETVASFASALAYRGTLNKRQVCPGLGRPYVAYSLGDVPHTETVDASQLRARGAVSFDSKYEVLKTLNAVGGLVRTVALAERSRYSVKTCRLVCVLLAQEGKVRAYKTARARGDYLWEALVSENEL